MKPLKPLYWDVDRWRHEGNRNPDTRPDTSDNPDIERACAFSDLVETGLRRDTADAMNAVDFDRLADRILSGVEQLDSLSPKPSPVRAYHLAVGLVCAVWSAAAVPLALLFALVWFSPTEPTPPRPTDWPKRRVKLHGGAHPNTVSQPNPGLANPGLKSRLRDLGGGERRRQTE
jgi:hypothetical protein